jgi:uncharacterized membrane protein YfcA
MDLAAHDYLLLFAAAALGGAVNSVAGGGTLLTFPALLWALRWTDGAARIANATSTVALWPGALSSLWGYRSEFRSGLGEIVALSVPSFLGGLLGASLLLLTSNALFAAIVPYLVLMATLLFMVQEPLSRWLRGREKAVPQALPRTLSRWLAVLAFQFLVGVYGGYFGAGIGILMLAAFGFLGVTNIHHMNALKNLNAMFINGIAAVLFIVKGHFSTEPLVDWRLALLMAAGAILGGYAGAGTARRIGQKNVRRLVILIGLSLAASLLVRQW